MPSARDKLRFDIVAKDKTTAAFKAVKRGLGGIAKAMKSVVVATAAVGAGLVYMVKKSLDSIDKVDKLSRTLGIGSKDLAAFELAARLGGSSMETFARAARTVAKNAFDFVTRGTGEAADAFEALGLSADDVKPVMNDNVELMGLIADRLNDMETGAVKTALAYKLFGGRAVELLPALEGGSQALRQAREEAESLGIALSQKAVTGVARANDAVTKLFLLFRGVRDQIVGALAPALETLANFLTGTLQDSIKQSGGDIETWARGWAKTILEGITRIAEGIGEFISRVKFATSNMFTSNGLGLNTLSSKIAATKSQINSLMEDMRDYASQLKNPETSAWPEEELRRRMDRTNEAIERQLSTLTELQAEYEKLKKQQPPLPPNPLREALNVLDGMIESLGRLGVSLDVPTRKARALGDEMRGMTKDVKAEVDRLFKETRTPLEKYQAQIARLNELLKQGAIDQDLYARAVKKAQDELDTASDKTNTLKDAAKELGLTFSSAFEDAIVEGKKFSDVLKSLAKDILRVLVRKSVTEPLTGFISKGIEGGLGSIFSGAGGGSTPPGSPGAPFGSNPPIIPSFPQFAAGGIADRPSIFGEGRMKEAAVPLPDGRRIPVDLRGGGGNTYVFNAPGADARQLQALKQMVVNLAGPGRVEDRAIKAMGAARGEGQLGKYGF